MKPVTRIVLLAGIVAATFFTGGQWNWAPAAWIGAVLTLRYYRATNRPVLDFIALSVLVGGVGAVTWRGVVPDVVTAPAPTAIIPITGAIIGMLVFVLDRWVHRRVGATVPASVVFPAAWTALDYFTTASPDIGTFGSVAYTQVGTPVMQLAALGGMPLVVFVVGWGASLAALVWERWGAVPRTAWAAVAVVVLMFVAGLVRPLVAPTPAQGVRVAGVSLPNGAINEALAADAHSPQFAEAVASTHRHLVAEAERLAAGDAELVVFPEGAGFGTQAHVAALRADLAEVARQHDVWIVLPILTVDTQPVANQVEVLNPSGEVVLSHTKYGGNAFEGSLRGDGQLSYVDTPFGRLSAVICWDADFPEVIGQAGAMGVDLMVIPANDWYEVRNIHADMSVLRAIENGMAVFRQTGSGVSLATDSHGRQLSRVDSFAPSDQAPGEQHVTLPAVPAATLYPMVGSTFAVVAAVGTLVALGWLVVTGVLTTRRRRSARRDAAATGVRPVTGQGRRDTGAGVGGRQHAQLGG